MQHNFVPLQGEYSHYEINQFGVVRHRYTGQICPVRCGERSEYYGVSLRPRNGIRSYTHHIHRLLAIAFIPNTTGLPIEQLDVNHIDGNKHNNQLSNLEWATRSHNCIHAYQNGLRNDNIVIELAPANGVGDHVFCYSQAEAARFLGVTPGSLCEYMRREDRYGCIPYHGYWVSYSDERSLGEYSEEDEQGSF